jgi:hypothetical protein
MMKQHAVMVVPALAFLAASAREAPAQLVSRVEAGALVSTRDGALPDNVFSVTPGIRYESERLHLAAQGSAWRIGEQWQLAGGELASTFLSPSLFGTRAEVTTRASRIYYDARYRSEQLDASARIHMLRKDRGGIWVGGGVERPMRVVVASSIDVASGGAWTRIGGATLSGSVTNVFFTKVTAVADSGGSPVACGTRKDELPQQTPAGGGPATSLGLKLAADGAQECRRQSRFSDLQGAVQWAFNALEVSAQAGYRFGDSYDVTPDSRRWASAVATYWVTSQIAAIAGGGRQPASPARGLPARSYANLGLMLAYWPIPRRTVPVAERATLNAFEVRETGGALPGERTIVVRAGGIERVEVMGSFTGWEPRALTRYGRDYWEITLSNPPGVHEINGRLDNGKWRPPPGMPARRDGFNGEVGILIVE